MAIWYILWQFGIFSPFWYFGPRKIWQPWIAVQYLCYNFESQIFELQIVKRYISELHISEQTNCRTLKLPNRQIVEHSTTCRTYWAVLF
jgi:hypothetical protein